MQSNQDDDPIYTSFKHGLSKAYDIAKYAALKGEENPFTAPTPNIETPKAAEPSSSPSQGGGTLAQKDDYALDIPNQMKLLQSYQGQQAPAGLNLKPWQDEANAINAIGKLSGNIQTQRGADQMAAEGTYQKDIKDTYAQTQQKTQAQAAQNAAYRSQIDSLQQKYGNLSRDDIYKQIGTGSIILHTLGDALKTIGGARLAESSLDQHTDRIIAQNKNNYEQGLNSILKKKDISMEDFNNFKQQQQQHTELTQHVLDSGIAMANAKALQSSGPLEQAKAKELAAQLGQKKAMLEQANAQTQQQFKVAQMVAQQNVLNNPLRVSYYDPLNGKTQDYEARSEEDKKAFAEKSTAATQSLNSLTQAQGILNNAEKEKRSLTSAEQANVNELFKYAQSVNPELKEKAEGLGDVYPSGFKSIGAAIGLTHDNPDKVRQMISIVQGQIPSYKAAYLKKSTVNPKILEYLLKQNQPQNPAK